MSFRGSVGGGGGDSDGVGVGGPACGDGREMTFSKRPVQDPAKVHFIYRRYL